MWGRMGYLGLVIAKCGRRVRVVQFTSDAEHVSCKACLNAMEIRAKSQAAGKTVKPVLESANG